MYCVKCRRKTQTKNIKNIMSKNKRKMKQGLCVVCGTKKTMFIK